MAYKSNWACAQCGMTSSRKESVIRHIVNPRIHNGRAQAIPYTDYMAGLRAGIYPPTTAHLYRMRRFSNQVTDEVSLSDRIERKVEEKYIDMIAEKIVKPSYNQLEPSHAPVFAKSAYKMPQPAALSLPPEKIFGIAGYVCNNCLVIKPKIILFNSSVDNRSSLSEIYPIQTCQRQGSGMSKEDETFYLNYNKIYGYGTALTRWIRGYWSYSTKMKIIAIKLPHPIIGASPISGVRIIMSDDRASVENTVLVSYDESEILDLSNHEGIVPTQNVENGLSIIMEAIKNSEYVIEGDRQPSEFLGQTKFSTFAFFRIDRSKAQSEDGKTPGTNEVFLVAALPYEMTINKRFTIEAVGNNQMDLSWVSKWSYGLLRSSVEKRITDI
jgi:hypothetical protein